MYSLNELDGLIRKSAVGAGLPVGYAEDLATAGVWLARRGLPVCEIIASGLSEKAFPPICYVQTDSGYTFSGAQAVMAGPAAIDLLLVADQSELEIELTGLDSPVLVLGFLGDAADRCREVFSLSLETEEMSGHAREYRLGPDAQIDPASFRPLGPCDAKVRRISKAGSYVLREGAIRYDPSDNLDTGWARLETLAQRVYVPASSESRQRGAGAGLTDND
ncbi:MAG: DUF3726 domain-containing protein [Hyphomicrobiaceae bacterium]